MQIKRVKEAFSMIPRITEARQFIEIVSRSLRDNYKRPKRDVIKSEIPGQDIEESCLQVVEPIQEGYYVCYRYLSNRMVRDKLTVAYNDWNTSPRCQTAGFVAYLLSFNLSLAPYFPVLTPLLHFEMEKFTPCFHMLKIKLILWFLQGLTVKKLVWIS